MWKVLLGYGQKESCPDHEHYGFIGNPPTNKRLDFVNAWKGIAEYFRSKNHSIISRYPVVCRWRDDLYFTIASIVDFQRVMGSKVVFEIPANPLIVPQMCLRFNDVENVTEWEHYTSFCMIGQTCDADFLMATGKTCVKLDYGMITTVLGIKPEEITLLKTYGWVLAFGNSLEYFAQTELGNAFH